MANNTPPPGTDVVFEQLKLAAAAPRLVTYGQLMGAAGLPAVGAGRRLDYIHAKLSAKSPSLPWLVAIAVSQTTGVPGTGLCRGTTLDLDLRDPAHRAWWRAMILHVFATDWSRVEL